MFDHARLTATRPSELDESRNGCESFHWYDRFREEEPIALPPRSAPLAPCRAHASPLPAAASPRRTTALKTCIRTLLLIQLGLVFGFAAGNQFDRLRELALGPLDGTVPASPDFSLDRFRLIRPGMTDDQVRDLIGNPCQRYGGLRPVAPHSPARARRRRPSRRKPGTCRRRGPCPA